MYEQKSFSDKLKSFDIYRKLGSTYLQPSCTGAILTLCTLIITLYLFIFEFSFYFATSSKTQMLVDTSRDSNQINVNLDITLFKYPCSIISLDIADKIGSHSFNSDNQLSKIELNKNKEETNPYTPVQLSGEDFFNKVKKDFQEMKGCRLTGTFQVTRVPGNFHISSHPYANVIQRLQNEDKNFYIDLSHKIGHLSFGEKENEKQTDEYLGAVHPLDGKERADNRENNIFEYYLNIVPSKFVNLDKKEFNTFQYTANSHIDKGQRNFPAIFFRMDISPILVKKEEIKPDYSNAVIHVCAIVGGMYSIAYIIDLILEKLLGFRKNDKKVGTDK